MADSQQQSSSKKRKPHQLKPSLRKKLKSQAQIEQSLSLEEKQRRQEQKRRRDIALKLRAEGKDYNPKMLRKQQRRDADGAGKGKHKSAKVKVKSSQRNKAPYNVVILPIAWHNRKEESARIIAACEKAEQLLQSAGLTCRIDDGDKFKPGQKMKYWELRGVHVRLEIGPKESLAGTAVLAVAAAAPGEVAQKSSVKVEELQLSQKVKAALQKFNALKPSEADDKANSADGHTQNAADDHQEQQQQKQEGKKQHKSKKRNSDLQQDADAAVQDDQTQQQQQEHKQKKHKKDKSGKAGKSSKADKAELKAKLALLVDEQHMVSNVADKVLAEDQQQQQSSTAKKQPERQQPQIQQQQQLLHAYVSGDALDDDLDLPVADVENKGKRGKGNNKKQKPDSHGDAGGGMVGLAAATAGFGGSETAASKQKRKQPKVVKF